jgi:hypothetical protein
MIIFIKKQLKRKIFIKKSSFLIALNPLLLLVFKTITQNNLKKVIFFCVPL